MFFSPLTVHNVVEYQVSGHTRYRKITVQMLVMLFAIRFLVQKNTTLPTSLSQTVYSLPKNTIAMNRQYSLTDLI